MRQLAAALAPGSLLPGSSADRRAQRDAPSLSGSKLPHSDTATEFPLWSKRYDSEMKDVFEVQDEIARSIAEALRIALSPQEQKAIAARPTENLQAYDLYLRGRNYARRMARQDLDFALQMFESAVALDPQFALARVSAERAIGLAETSPEALLAQAWVAYAEDRFDDAISCIRRAVRMNPAIESGYYLLLRLLFAIGRYQELVELSEEGLSHSAEDYNTFVPITNALGALGKADALRNMTLRQAGALEAAGGRHQRQQAAALQSREIFPTLPSSTGFSRQPVEVAIQPSGQLAARLVPGTAAASCGKPERQQAAALL